MAVKNADRVEAGRRGRIECHERILKYADIGRVKLHFLRCCQVNVRLVLTRPHVNAGKDRVKLTDQLVVGKCRTN